MVSLTWILRDHEDCFSSVWKDREGLFKDCVVLKNISREENWQELGLGTHTEDIPIYHFIQAKIQM